MDYRFTHPLYEKGDEDAAIEFLASNMMDNTNLIALDNDQSDTKQGQQDNKELLKFMTKNLVKTMYGVNLIDMANYTQVQEVFYSKYASYIVQYLGLCGVNARLIMFNPASISPYAIKKYVQLNPDKILMRYNPEEKWDYKVSDDITKNIMNPLNGMDIVVLYLGNIKDKMPTLLKALYGGYSEDELNYENLAIKILPTKSYESILELVKIINTIF